MLQFNQEIQLIDVQRHYFGCVEHVEECKDNHVEEFEEHLQSVVEDPELSDFLDEDEPLEDDGYC